MSKRTIAFWKTLIFILVVFGAGLGVGYYLISNLKNCPKSNFEYINPGLQCNSRLVIGKQGYAKLKVKLEDFIALKVKNGEAEDVSIYFRDLEDGPTLGLDEHLNFAPASLLKLPYLLTFFQLAQERGDELFDTQLAFRIDGKDPTAEQFYPPRERIEENKPYSIGELLRRLIVYSDNRALEVLAEYLTQVSPTVDLARQTIYNLGVVSDNNSGDDFVSVKSYASIFVQLYNASFLSKEMSERALAFLAETDFKSGLVAGVPGDMKVAHKFGERYVQDSGVRQLHDCGIIYFPKNPYLLCVMTRGKDFKPLEGIISTVSKMFYDEVGSRRIN